jgi:hypothetical protein
MNRHEFMTTLHQRIAPRNDVEIGLSSGAGPAGLVGSGTRTIGVDPTSQAETSNDVQLVDATSDDFYARADAIAWFDQDTVDLTVIDGLHIFEFALRDFINAERLSSPGSVIVLDDVLPRSKSEAARDRYTVSWAGDVYKVAEVLEAYRPDLVVVRVDTEPTGLLLVVGLNPTNTVLSENHDKILAEHVAPDPQNVPHDVLHRTTAANPEKVLASLVWADLVAARNAGGPAPTSLRSLLDLRGTGSYVSESPSYKPEPKPAAAKAAKKKQGSAKPRKSAAKSKARKKKTVVQRLRAKIRRALS